MCSGLACRGKLLNVRDAAATQISGNVEIQAIKQILGLQHGKVSLHQCVVEWHDVVECMPASNA